jgi:hypothetical protein
VRHGTNHNLLGVLFGVYAGHTPDVECGDNTTIILGANDEPQPDLYLRVLPDRGGQSRTTAAASHGRRRTTTWTGRRN